MNDFSRFNPLDEAGEQDTDSRGGSPFRERLGTRSLVLVGLMGAGKSTVGRRLAQKLGLG